MSVFQMEKYPNKLTEKNIDQYFSYSVEKDNN